VRVVTRWLLLVAALVIGSPAWASYSCDGTDDQLQGTLTTNRSVSATGVTILTRAKFTTHTGVASVFAQLGSSPSNTNTSIMVRTAGAVNNYNAASNDSGTIFSGSNNGINNDGVWASYVGVFASTTSRTFYVNGIAGTTGTDTSDPGSALNDVALCENLGGAQDFAGLIGETCLVTGAATQQNATDFANGIPCGTIFPGAELFAWYKLDTNNATQPNDGSDATGDLTVSNATFSTDDPVFSSLTAGPTESTNTATTVVFTFTPSQAGTVHWLLRNSGTSASADCPAIQTHTGAMEFGSKAVTGADSVTVDFDRPKGDFDICLVTTAGSLSSIVYTVNDVIRNACSGCAIAELGTLSTTSPFSPPVDTAGDTTADSTTIAGMTSTARYDVGSLVTVSGGFPAGVKVVESKTATSLTLDTAATSTVSNVTVTGRVNLAGTAFIVPTPTTGDALEYQTTDSNGGTVSYDTSWDLTNTPQMGEEALFTEITHPTLQDISDTTPAYTAPLDVSFKIYSNNPAPVLNLAPVANIPFTVGVAITPIDFASYCSHPNLPVVISLHSGSSWPATLSLDGSGVLTGTVDAEDEDGTEVTILCGADDLYDSEIFRFFPITTLPAPDCTTTPTTSEDCQTLFNTTYFGTNTFVVN
jgi:hypothetical protein